jgi:hypothetical protein
VLDAVGAGTDWFVCNAAEARRLTGERDPAAAASEVARRWARVGAVVRLGADGCLVATGGDVVAVPAPAVRPWTPTAPGTTHTGVLIAACSPVRRRSARPRAPMPPPRWRHPAGADDDADVDRDRRFCTRDSALRSIYRYAPIGALLGSRSSLRRPREPSCARAGPSPSPPPSRPAC